MTEYETNMIKVIFSEYRIKGGIDIFLKSTNETIKQNIKDIVEFTEEGKNKQVFLAYITGGFKFETPLEDIGFRINDRELTLRQVKTVIMYLEALDDRV